MSPVTFDESVVASSDNEDYDDASLAGSEATDATDLDHDPRPEILLGPDRCRAPMVHLPTGTQRVCNMPADKCQRKGHRTLQKSAKRHPVAYYRELKPYRAGSLPDGDAMTCREILQVEEERRAAADQRRTDAATLLGTPTLPAKSEFTTETARLIRAVGGKQPSPSSLSFEHVEPKPREESEESESPNSLPAQIDVKPKPSKVRVTTVTEDDESLASSARGGAWRDMKPKPSKVKVNTVTEDDESFESSVRGDTWRESSENVKHKQTIDALRNELKLMRKQAGLSKAAVQTEPGWNDIESRFERLAEEEYNLRREAEQENQDLKKKLAEAATLDKRFARLAHRFTDTANEQLKELELKMESRMTNALADPHSYPTPRRRTPDGASTDAAPTRILPEEADSGVTKRIAFQDADARSHLTTCYPVGSDKSKGDTDIHGINALVRTEEVIKTLCPSNIPADAEKALAEIMPDTASLPGTYISMLLDDGGADAVEGFNEVMGTLTSQGFGATGTSRAATKYGVAVDRQFKSSSRNQLRVGMTEAKFAQIAAMLPDLEDDHMTNFCHHLRAVLFQIEWLSHDDIEAYVEAGRLRQLVESSLKNYQRLFEFIEKKRVQVGWSYAQVLVNHYATRFNMIRAGSPTRPLMIFRVYLTLREANRAKFMTLKVHAKVTEFLVTQQQIAPPPNGGARQPGALPVELTVPCTHCGHCHKEPFFESCPFNLKESEEAIRLAGTLTGNAWTQTWLRRARRLAA